MFLGQMVRTLIGFSKFCSLILFIDKPVYLSMDELLNFGAPSIPYSAVHDRDNPLAWRPLEWEFVEGKYPHMVAIGVNERAVRFNGQEVRAHGEPCWGLLGQEYCKHGTTISAWISITRFPMSSHLRIVDTGINTSFW